MVYSLHRLAHALLSRRLWQWLVGIIGAVLLIHIAGSWLVGRSFSVWALQGFRNWVTAFQPEPKGPLNPHGFPRLPMCKSIRLDHSVEEAAANIARGDLRPFTVYGFTPTDVPGVFCPHGRYEMESRGGRFVSDIPDACGGMSFSNAPGTAMLAYNRIIAANPRFQAVTGCRPSTYCEERYRKGWADAPERDPQCPAEPGVLRAIAERGSVATLKDALQDFKGRSPHMRDAVTIAFVSALGAARWDNARLLLKAGADVNGRAFAPAQVSHPWLRSPLEALFNQTRDEAHRVQMADWLFEQGGNFSNPEAANALRWAAFSNDVAAVRYLVSKGAPVNHGNGGSQALVEAVKRAQLPYAEDDAKDKAFAEAEHKKARVIAVILYRAGARLPQSRHVRTGRDQWDVATASIVLAVAERQGGWEAMAAQLPGETDGSSPESGAAPSPLGAYIAELRKCSRIAPRPQEDRVKLCAHGAV